MLMFKTVTLLGALLLIVVVKSHATKEDSAEPVNFVRSADMDKYNVVKLGENGTTSKKPGNESTTGMLLFFYKP